LVLPTHAVVLAGLVVLLVSLPLPFAENEAGGSDHYYGAHRWYVWHPFHNFGMLPLLFGILLLVRAWHGPGRRPRAFLVGEACGWIGLLLLYGWAPEVLQEFLYGGPDVQLLGTRWVVGVGWALLSLGALLWTYGVRPIYVPPGPQP